MSLTLSQRFWRKVDRSGGFDACWPWCGYVNPNGYGYFRVGQRVVRVHRVAIVLAGVRLEAGQNGLHECDNTICCNAFNPEKHLRAGTQSENLNGMYRRGRRMVKVNEPARLLYLGYCPWCGRDIPATFCDHCQREVAG